MMLQQQLPMSGRNRRGWPGSMTTVYPAQAQQQPMLTTETVQAAFSMMAKRRRRCEATVIDAKAAAQEDLETMIQSSLALIDEAVSWCPAGSWDVTQIGSAGGCLPWPSTCLHLDHHSHPSDRRATIR